jgi:hypothetical protein
VLLLVDLFFRSRATSAIPAFVSFVSFVVRIFQASDHQITAITRFPDVPMSRFPDVAIPCSFVFNPAERTVFLIDFRHGFAYSERGFRRERRRLERVCPRIGQKRGSPVWGRPKKASTLLHLGAIRVPEAAFSR